MSEAHITNTWPALALAGLIAITACADDGRDDEFPRADEDTQVDEPMEPMGDPAEARELVTDALETTEKMNDDAELWSHLEQARGIFVIPRFGQAAVGVGARGGEGVLLTRSDGGWTGPAFYDIGGVSVGAQLGGQGGEVVMLLMNDEAVQAFRQEDNFSLNADAGITLADYSALAQGTVDDADVVLWSDTEGVFAGVALSVTDIHFDEEENRAYYGQQVRPDQILDGSVTGPQMNDIRSRLSR